jgi:hypothetical protein
MNLSLLQSQNYQIYLPIIMKPVPEYDVPPCRWPHTYGGYDARYYKWGNYLQTPGTAWRNAFESAIIDWNNAPTKLTFLYSINGSIMINLYYQQDGLGGYAVPLCGETNTIGYYVFGNGLTDTGNPNIRHSTAGHELGHSLGIGHISGYDIALMGYNPDPNIYYTPQPIDIALVNQVYP